MPNLYMIEIGYGVGVIFAVCLAINMFARKLVSSFTAKTMMSFPLYVFTGFVLGLVWPIMIFRDSGFREAVVECGRIAVLFGYLFCFLATLAYPRIWLWYIAGVALWLSLEKYHYRSSAQPRE